MWHTLALQRNWYINNILKPLDEPIETNDNIDQLLNRESLLAKINENPGEAWKHDIAYGDYGIKKLVLEINSKDEVIQNRTLVLLIDELRNPLKIIKALKEHYIVKRLLELFMKRIIGPNQGLVLERITKIFSIISMNPVGQVKLIEEPKLIEQFFNNIQGMDPVSINIAKTLMYMASNELMVELMIKENHFKKIFDVLKRIDTINEVFIQLSYLIKFDNIGALDEGYFEYFLPKIDQDNEQQGVVLKCFSLLINCEKAHKKCDDNDVVYILYNIIKKSENTPEVLENAIHALQNCTMSTVSLWRCREFWDLPIILIQKANYPSPTLQLYCFQTLRKITVMPSVKDFVRKVCKMHLKKIVCRSKYANEAREELFEWLRKKPYPQCCPKC